MFENPFDEKDRDSNRVGDNTPIAIPDSQEYPQVQPEAGTKSDRTLWFTIGGITLTACCVAFLVVYTFLQSNPFQNVFTNQYPTLAPTVLPNLTATQRAWVRPSKSPTLGTAEEAKEAVEADVLSHVESFSNNHPFQPEINQPGDIYIYNVKITTNEKLLWDYGWCTTTPEILDENFGKMRIVFNLNSEPVPQRYFAITEHQREDGGYCRTYTALITNWPKGQHQLESRVTFTQPTHDGWNLYPAGMHMFKYFVTVE
jgi:hypothetical protein